MISYRVANIAQCMISCIMMNLIIDVIRHLGLDTLRSFYISIVVHCKHFFRIFPGKCLPEGLVDVTDCYYGFPIALSYPHFLDANPALLDNVTGGISPNRSEHESYFHINPVSVRK